MIYIIADMLKLSLIFSSLSIIISNIPKSISDILRIFADIPFSIVFVIGWAPISSLSRCVLPFCPSKHCVASLPRKDRVKPSRCASHMWALWRCEQRRGGKWLGNGLVQHDSLVTMVTPFPKNHIDDIFTYV